MDALSKTPEEYGVRINFNETKDDQQEWSKANED